MKLRFVDSNLFNGVLAGRVALKKPTETGVYLLRIEWSKTGVSGSITISWEGSFDPTTIEYVETSRMETVYQGTPPVAGLFTCSANHKPLSFTLWRVEDT